MSKKRELRVLTGEKEAGRGGHSQEKDGSLDFDLDTAAEVWAMVDPGN